MGNNPWIGLFSGLIGALVGAFSNAFIHYTRERKASREELVGEIAAFSDECIAAVTDIQGCVVVQSETLELWKARSEYQRKYASGLSLEIRVFQMFRSRIVRAAFHKTLDRLDEFKKFVDVDKPTTLQKFSLAENWVRAQIADTVELAARKAGIETTDRGGFYFAGFSKKEKKEYVSLVSRMEHHHGSLIFV
jgi:hypothetical protein